MASRHQRSTSIGEYLPYHLNAASTPAALSNPTVAATGTPSASGGTLPSGAYTVAYAWVRAAADINNNTSNTTDNIPAVYATTTTGTSTSGTITVTGPTGSIAVNTNAALPGGASVQWWIISAPAGVATGPVGAPQTGQTFTITSGATVTVAAPATNTTNLVRLPIVPTASFPALDRGKGVFLGTVCINDFGTAGTWVLNVYNGLGGAAGGGANICAIKPNTNVTLDMNNVLDYGLFYALAAGTGTVSITLNVLPVA